MTFDEVIEEHRLAIGATKVHVSLEPDATPEGLKIELARLREKDAEWASFPIELRLRAEIAQLHKRLTRISRLAQTEAQDFIDGKEHPDVTALKRAVFRETDIIALNMEEALEFCRKGGRG